MSPSVMTPELCFWPTQHPCQNLLWNSSCFRTEKYHLQRCCPTTFKNTHGKHTLLNVLPYSQMSSNTVHTNTQSLKLHTNNSSSVVVELSACTFLFLLPITSSLLDSTALPPCFLYYVKQLCLRSLRTATNVCPSTCWISDLDSCLLSRGARSRLIWLAYGANKVWCHVEVRKRSQQVHRDSWFSFCPISLHG